MYHLKDHFMICYKPSMEFWKNIKVTNETLDPISTILASLAVG